MIEFACDYHEGAHPRVLEKLISTNMEQTTAYGSDLYCKAAAEIIKEKCENRDVSIHFFVGGTQTNLVLITSALRTHQCVISPSSGHIYVQETGAIEAAGHKIVTIPHKNGKITAEQIKEKYDEYWNDRGKIHLTQPKLVFITHSTELGTIYTRSELQDISRVCRKNNLYLYLDGARLGYGLCAEDSDLDLPCITECCDAFYIGGTKQGTLFGEALIIKNKEIAVDFCSIMKQRGSLLAKGRLLGLQFIALFENNLYFELSRHANAMASIIRNKLVEKGTQFLVKNTTNQIFPILKNVVLEELKKKYSFSHWAKHDNSSTIVRICTNWATSEDNVGDFLDDIEKIV